MQVFSEPLHIAVLEDDPALREMWGWMLEDEGYDVACYTHPAEFYAVLAEQTIPHLLLLDLGLPPQPDSAEEGLAVLEQLAVSAPDLKVIVLTGQNQDANVYRAIKAGAFDFIAKPVSVDHLLLAVKRALMFRQQEQRLQSEEGARRLVIDAPMDQGMKAVRNEAEKRLLTAIVHETDFNVHEMARRMGIKRENVYYLLKKYELTRD